MWYYITSVLWLLSRITESSWGKFGERTLTFILLPWGSQGFPQSLISGLILNLMWYKKLCEVLTSNWNKPVLESFVTTFLIISNSPPSKTHLPSKLLPSKSYLQRSHQHPYILPTSSLSLLLRMAEMSRPSAAVASHVCSPQIKPLSATPRLPYLYFPLFPSPCARSNDQVSSCWLVLFECRKVVESSSWVEYFENH